MNRRRTRSFLSLLVLIVATSYAVWESRRSGAALSPAVQSATNGSKGAPARRTLTRLDLSSVPQNERAELERTVSLIDAGGPFGYKNDGATFRNAERRLPPKPKSYYREFTVKSPEARGRGARRVVAGAEGELYYTRDHYRTFVKIRNSE